MKRKSKIKFETQSAWKVVVIWEFLFSNSNSTRTFTVLNRCYLARIQRQYLCLSDVVYSPVCFSTTHPPNYPTVHLSVFPSIRLLDWLETYATSSFKFSYNYNITGLQWVIISLLRVVILLLEYSLTITLLFTNYSFSQWYQENVSFHCTSWYIGHHFWQKYGRKIQNFSEDEYSFPEFLL